MNIKYQKCTKCNGTGLIVNNTPAWMMNEPSPYQCDKCEGSGMIEQSKSTCNAHDWCKK